VTQPLCRATAKDNPSFNETMQFIDESILAQPSVPCYLSALSLPRQRFACELQPVDSF
jgi:hypothetical protein